MKTRLLITLTTFLLLAAAAFGQERAGRDRLERTVVVRDGKVLEDGTRVIVDGALLGGKRAFLGVQLIGLTPELREHFGAPKSSGALVGSVEAGSPAEKSGLRVGDIVIAVDGKDINSSFGLRHALAQKKEGDSIRLDVLRGRSRQTLGATVTEREAPTMFRATDLGELPRVLGERFNSPEWRARVETLQNCGELQSKLRDIEGRMKELEKKLQK